MNTNMTGFRWYQKSLHPYAIDESSLSIGRVKFTIALLKIALIVCFYLKGMSS